jgi:hypothetical protein
MAAPSAAANYVTVTKCDTVSIGGETYPTVEFEVTNQYPDPLYPICSILLVPKAAGAIGDTCRAIASFGGAGWDHDADPNGRVIWIQNSSETLCVWPGSTGGGFRVVLSRAHNCCYRAEFYGALFDPFAVEDICFNCDLPTAAHASTWGQVKGIYR